jgi:hypothetical protein
MEDPPPRGDGESPPTTLNRSKEKIRGKEKAPRKRKKAIPLPESWEPTDAHRTMAREYGVDLEEEVAQFRDHALANGRSLKDWDAGFRTWLRKAKQFKRDTPQNFRKLREDELARDEERKRKARARAEEERRRRQEAEEKAQVTHRQKLVAWYLDLPPEKRTEVDQVAEARARKLFGGDPPPGLVKATKAQVCQERSQIPLPRNNLGDTLGKVVKAVTG